MDEWMNERRNEGAAVTGKVLKVADCGVVVEVVDTVVVAASDSATSSRPFRKILLGAI